MENRMTKMEKFNAIKNILDGMEGDNISMLIEFVQAEQNALANKAAKAKAKAAEKKTEIDALGNAVLGALNAAPMTRDEVFALVADFEDGVSVAKVGARLTKLVAAGSVVVSDVKATTASGKKTTRKAYALALTDAEPCNED